MLADAETRSHLSRSQSGAGHDGSFFVQSADGANRLEVSGYLQFRYIANIRNAPAYPDPAANGDFRVGFQTRRTRLTFSGHVIDPSILFRVSGNLSEEDGGLQESDAWVRKAFGNGWQIQWGQFKLPFLHETLTSSTRQIAVERSVMEQSFTLGRTIGVMGAYESDRLQARLAFSNGGDSANRDPVADESNWAFTGRIDFVPAGEYDLFRKGGATADVSRAALIGLAFHA